MQRLIYQNLLGEQAVFHLPPYLLESVSGTQELQSDILTARGAYQHGDTTTGMLAQHREVEAAFALVASSRVQLYEARRRLCGVLAPQRALSPEGKQAKLFYENDLGKWWTYAVPMEGPTFGARKSNALLKGRLRFRCERPYWYAYTENRASFTYSGTGLALPASFPLMLGQRDYQQTVINYGHVSAPVRVAIVGQGEVPSLINLTTGARIELTQALPVGSTLYCNTDPAELSATVIDQDGATTSAFGMISVDRALSDFTLRPGSNELSYAPGGAQAKSSIYVRWFAPYQGV